MYYLLLIIIIYNLGGYWVFFLNWENLDKLILLDRCIFCEFV